MAKQEFSIASLANRIPDEASAYKLLEDLRWGGEPAECPQCGATGKFYFLKPQDGTTGRKTRTGANSQRRVWKCATCRKQFSVLTNTIFHGTKIPVRTWLFVIFEFCAAKNSVSAREIRAKVQPDRQDRVVHGAPHPADAGRQRRRAPTDLPATDGAVMVDYRPCD